MSTLSNPNPNKLKALRKQKGLTTNEVAQKMGFASHKSILDIELGLRKIKEEELLSLLEIYGASLEDINPNSEDKLLILLRADNYKLSDKAKNFFSEIVHKIKQIDYFQTLAKKKNITQWQNWVKPFFNTPTNLKEAVEQGQQLAKSLRNDLNLGQDPIENISYVTEVMGLRVIEIPLEKDLKGNNISGFLTFSHNYGPFIFIKKQDPDERKIFSIAHEICHLLVDCYPFDKWDNDSYSFEDTFQEHQRDYREVRANSFAASFLLPEDGLKTYIHEVLGKGSKDINQFDIVKIQARYHISFQAILFRLRNLDLISKSSFESISDLVKSGKLNINQLYKQLDLDKCSSFTIDTNKNLDSIIKSSAIEAYLAGEISTGKLCEVFGYSAGNEEILLAELQIPKIKHQKSQRKNPLLD